MEHNVKMIKLITSEEIICDIVRIEETKIVVRNPFAVAPNLDSPNGNPRALSVFPWSLAVLDISDKEYEISSHAVVMIADPPKQICESYLAKASGLSIPNTGIITG